MAKEVDTVIDGHKIFLHPKKEAIWDILGDCYPIHIEAGITNRCNHKCIFCALDFLENRGTDIDRDVMISALEDMAKPKIKYSLSAQINDRTGIYEDNVKSIMFGGEGEPTLHPYLGLFTQKAKEFGLDVALTTNGVRFNKEQQEMCLPHLSWVKFSVDAGTSKTYSKVHGTGERNFNTLLDNISSSIRLKREQRLDVTIGTQYLMLPQNMGEEDLKSIIGIFKEIHPDYLAIKPYSDHPKSPKDLIVQAEDYKRLEKILKETNPQDYFKVLFREGTIQRIQKGNTYPACYGLPFITLVDSKGNMLPCNLFYDNEEFTYGNLYKNNFSEIWTSQKRKEVINKLRMKGMEECRKGCRCDAGNNYLSRIKNPLAHDNFT